jgi:serine protease
MNVSPIRRAAVVMVALLFAAGIILPVFSSGTTRVWVEYRPGQQGAVRGELQRIGAKIHYEFQEVSAFVVTVPENALSGLGRSPHIAGLEIDPEREWVRSFPADEAILPAGTLTAQEVPYGVVMVQAQAVWDANADGKIDKHAPTGAGRTICIIDSGLYTGHEDMQGVNISGGYSQVDVSPSEWSVDGLGHGTHVAGTIAAMHNDFGVVGVSPGTVQLYIVKIFDNAGNWVMKKHASDLVAAALDCADHGANIISMSLSGTLRNGYEEKIWNQLYAAGILPVAAASNDGIEVYHYPASYPAVISVAAVDSRSVVADFSQHNDQVELAAPGVGVLSTVPFIEVSKVTVAGKDYAGYHMEFTPYGSASGILVNGELCLTTGDWAGKVVLCERGGDTFYTKVMNVQASGGVAAVVYNNIDGDFGGTLGDGNTSTILSITILRDYGLELLTKLGQEAEVVSLEPQWPASGYESWSGTSMATPHVAAVAALIWSWDPGLTNDQIRLAMQETAYHPLGYDRDEYYGFGIVQAKDALESLGYRKPGKK